MAIAVHCRAALTCSDRSKIGSRRRRHLGNDDDIFGLGILVGLEMGLLPVPLLTEPRSARACFWQGATVTVDAERRFPELTKPEGSSLYR